jgi:hypothetical protein
MVTKKRAIEGHRIVFTVVQCYSEPLVIWPEPIYRASEEMIV